MIGLFYRNTRVICMKTRHVLLSEELCGKMMILPRVMKKLNSYEANLHGYEANLNGNEAKLNGYESNLNGYEANLNGYEANLSQQI